MEDNILLIERLQQGEDVENEIINNNMGLVLSVVQKFLYSGVEYDDLAQIGTIGLIKAVRNFDLDRGVMFSTYAVPVIIGEIKKFLRDNGSVKVSRSLREQYMKLQRTREFLVAKLEREPTLGELSEHTGISVEEIPLALDAGSRPLSLDEPMGSEGSLTLSDTICDEKNNDIEHMALRESISKLEPFERKLISLRYFLNKTQQQTAEILGITQVQVSRKEKKIIEKMRDKMLC